MAQQKALNDAQEEFARARYDDGFAVTDIAKALDVNPNVIHRVIGRCILRNLPKPGENRLQQLGVSPLGVITSVSHGISEEHAKATMRALTGKAGRRRLIR